MSVEEVLEEMIHNVKVNAQNIDRRIDDRLDNPDEDLKILAGQTRQLAQQIDSLCTILQKKEEYKEEE